ncbi:hypothetical protein BDF14DRAFT_1819527 [Spinellus fusiger]|nr:hypothetical protein BDF14DRAFT_1819527 [Spinellus fusiger]
MQKIVRCRAMSWNKLNDIRMQSHGIYHVSGFILRTVLLHLYLFSLMNSATHSQSTATSNNKTQTAHTTVTTRTSSLHLQESPSTSLSKLKAHLAHQQKVLHDYYAEKEHYVQESERLTEAIAAITEKTYQKQLEREQLQQNYETHLQSLRATKDTVDTIRVRLHTIKQNIASLATELIEKADPSVATHALQTFWLNLREPIERMGDPLPSPRIKMLTEKFIMDVLVQNMNLSTFPGLTIGQNYKTLIDFFEDYDPCLSIRLRQEITRVVVSKNTPGTEIHQVLRQAVLSNWKFLYAGLTKAFPFVYQQDKADAKMYYGSKVQMLVEQAMTLGFAMKGQEVDITAAETREQLQAFDPDFMVDEDGQMSGIVEFCICPPFVLYTETPRPIEKGRVLCSIPGSHLP